MTNGTINIAEKINNGLLILASLDNGSSTPSLSYSTNEGIIQLLQDYSYQRGTFATERVILAKLSNFNVGSNISIRSYDCYYAIIKNN